MKKARRGGFLVGILVAVLLTLLRWLDPQPLQDLRAASLDLYQRLKPRAAVETPVTVLAIDEASLKAQGQWPWPRHKLAELNARLLELGAASVSYDILFAEADRLSPATIGRDLGLSDPQLLAALRDSDADFAAAIAGQNLGAGQPERSRQAVWQAARMGLVIAVVVGSLFLTIPGALLGLFGLTQPDTVRLGTELLAYLSVSGLFITVALTFTGGLQGTGDTRSPLFITLASQFALPIGMLTALQATRPLQPRDIWLAIVLGHALRCVLSVWRFEQGKWKSIEVKLG